MASSYEQRRAVGVHGENVAADYLRAQGMRVIDRNWRCRWGEIDIVAQDDDALVFCEVKTRRSAAYGTPLEAVTPQKAARLRRLAGVYLSEHQPGAGLVRIDVVAVVVPARGAAEITHVVGAA
ncbi:YraN family protein [Mumia sp. zg.B53]|uniref:YraN family protein n=1 Tax=Mumia sp. zg.B53 TaxID=2855449 RepID=UPI001C6E378E|nr:YraN family protein [Mumia sp. zg.B53]MBW9216428.1 YraN family protein [Mumia sp. zg.B53]